MEVSSVDDYGFRFVPIGRPFYVDTSCIDCDLCRETAPATFRRDENIGLSIVFHQPETSEEWEQAREAMHGYPTETIGEDGLEAEAAKERVGECQPPN